MKTKFMFILSAGLCMLILVANAQAVPFVLNFTATDFTKLSGANPPPATAVSGSISWEASDINAPISALTGVNIDIAGTHYSLAQSTFSSDALMYNNQVGGALGGSSLLQIGANDYLLAWNYLTNIPTRFRYTAAADPDGSWESSNFSTFDVSQAAPVPEPATMLLFCTGIVGLAGTKMRRKKNV